MQTRTQPHPFQATEDVVSPKHGEYRTARAYEGREHRDMFAQAMTNSVYPVTLAQSQADCDAMLAGINTGEFKIPLYMTRFVAKTLKKMVAEKRGAGQPRMIVDNFPESGAQPRGTSVVAAGIEAQSRSEHAERRTQAVA